MSIGFWVEIVLFSLGNIETYLKHCPKLYSDLLKSICTNKIYKNIGLFVVYIELFNKVISIYSFDIGFKLYHSYINKSFILIDFEMCLMDISVNSTKTTLIHFSKRDVTPQTIYTKRVILSTNVISAISLGAIEILIQSEGPATDSLLAMCQ